MSKFYIANQIHPKTIMMGTSRIGLFPESQLEPYVEGPIYNLSLAGSTIEEQAMYIRYMIEHQPIKNVVWSMDFFSFNPTKPIDPSFDYKRFRHNIYWPDYTVSLFHFKTLKRSFQTVISQNNQVDMRLAQTQIRSNIQATLKEYATQKSFLKSEQFKIPSSIDSNINTVNSIVTLCQQKHINCIIYTSPVYYQHINMIYSLGLGKTFEYWKHSLSTVTPYSDFCTYNDITKNMLNFRDSSHVKSEIGNVLFKHIFTNKGPFLYHDDNLSMSKQ